MTPSVPAGAVNEVKTFNIPTCAFCQEHWEATQRYNSLVNWVMGLALFAGFGFYKATENSGWVTWIVGIIVLIGGAKLVLMALRPAKLTEPGHVDPGAAADTQPVPVTVSYSADKGKITVQFSFLQDGFAKVFAELNPTAVIKGG